MPNLENLRNMRLWWHFKVSAGMAVTTLYHLSVKIIGKGSGRSAVGAAAYRAGEKLQAVRSAAYRSGETLEVDGAEITHDYTKKGGVVHSEILLPESAPEKFRDRETLWNAVEARERRVDARLAREIEVALQAEFELQEQKELLREYIKDNFVDKGMIADVSIHDKGDGNPHAHIMLTTRNVTPDGFGDKNREWDKKEKLLDWREKWAEVTNRKFKQKGLAERIDYRSYKEQGIDREPTIHLGHEAWALEKRGIPTERGNINRKIKRRNQERATQKAEREQRLTESTAERKLSYEEYTVEKTVQNLNELKESYTALEKELSMLIIQRNEERQEIPRLNFRAEEIDEHTKNIEVLQDRVTQLQDARQNLNFLQWVRKKETDKAIKRAEQKVRRAEVFFKNRFSIDPTEASEEIRCTQEKIRANEADINTKNASILRIMDKQDKVLLAYHTQKLLAETRYNKEQISQLLERMNKSPETVRDRLLQERIDLRLNIIPVESFQNVIEKLSEDQAKILIEERKRTEEKEHTKTCEHTRTIDLSLSR
jgi:hypothetical protein